jgi:radical SAM superfamily enzyme YgiQ (UPF0313 family)
MIKVTLTTLNAKYIHSCLAVRYLKVACRDLRDVAVEIKEYTINHLLLDIVSDLYVGKPDVIGFACYIWNIEMTLKVVSLLRKVLPNVVVVLGGPEVTYDVATVFKECPDCDYIVLGEGEQVFCELLDALRQGIAVSNCVGLVGRENDLEKAVPCAFVPDLNLLSLPYEDEEMDELADKIIYYESSRGCPFSCQYCLSSATQGVRYRDIQQVFQDLNFFVKHEVKQVKFVDRTFNANKKHYFPILKYIQQLHTKTNFHFEIAIELLDDDVIDFLTDMPKGRIQFEIGIQSTHEPTLAAIERHNCWDDIVRKVTKLKSYNNIHLHLDLIVGLPLESRKIFRQSFNDVYGLQPHMLQLGFLKMLKGSGIRSSAKQYDYVWMDQPPYEVLHNELLPYSDVRELKLIEDVFEQLYNKGRFRATLRRLVELSTDAFAFYEQFTLLWEQQSLHKVAHSTKDLYQELAHYVDCYYPRERALMGQFMKYDALIHDKGKIRPEFLPWNGKRYEKEISAFWHSQKGEKVVKDFSFRTWREIQKKFHIEVFDIAVIDYVHGQGLRQDRTVLLFDYRGAETQCVPIGICDFWQEEGKE